MNNIPTVTKLLKLLDKPALLNWANKIGLQGIKLDDYYTQSKSKGNSYHNQVEDMIKHNKEIEDPVLRKNYHKFFDGCEILECEKNITCKHWRGRYDVKFKKDCITYLCDFKSNSGAGYLENKLQLVAYSEIENVDKIGIITLPFFLYKDVDIKDRKPYVGILKALSHIYKCKLQIDA